MILGRLGAVLVALVVFLAFLGRSWGGLGRSWASLGAILARSWAALGLSLPRHKY